jgi:hypothetical protein
MMDGTPDPMMRFTVGWKRHLQKTLAEATNPVTKKE